jgi:hypothetical protein
MRGSPTRNALTWSRFEPFSRKAGAVLAAWLTLLALSNLGYAWGPEAHRLVNAWAIQVLPADIRPFFEVRRQFLIEHANDPDEWMRKDRYERMRHYIYLDKYGLFPYLALPHTLRAAQEKYGTGHINHTGLLPWQIGSYSLKLTNDLRGRKWDDAQLDAAVLAHYVADAHDPLHTTQNYDGQLTGQAGLEMRFSSSLIEKYRNFFMLHPRDAAKIEDPTEYAFQMALEANTWVDRIVFEDRRAKDDLIDYNEDYFDRFYTAIGSTAVSELNEAAHDAGCYWYTAWLNAGKPAPPVR